MTPPLPEGRGFSGRFRTLKGQPGPEYVDRGVHVCVRLVAAREAPEHRLADAVPRRDVPALRASLRGVTGVHLNHHPPGALSLGAQDIEEHPPSRVENRSVQAGLRSGPVRLIGAVAGWAWSWPPRHIRYVQRFMPDHVVVADKRERDLMGVVQPRAAHLAVQCRDFADGLAAAVAAAPFAGERLLDRTGDIRISDREHGPAGDRRYRYLPTFILRGLTRLNLEFPVGGEAAP